MSSQAAQHGLAHWMPLSGTGVPYHPNQNCVYLSGLSSSFAMPIFPPISYDPICVEQPADYPWDRLKRMLDMHRRARPFFREDLYPLLDYVHSNQCWGAMQYHRSTSARACCWPSGARRRRSCLQISGCVCSIRTRPVE